MKKQRIVEVIYIRASMNAQWGSNRCTRSLVRAKFRLRCISALTSSALPACVQHFDYKCSPVFPDAPNPVILKW